ncbi:hypothetical protein SKAU_G00251750 [Synaphobranchus kaupii]|uniref:Uncharacterized protein n=1 Tax=Synaphobranchus kaupii TaxID=118154 RepID=A0A9Q1IRY0_SYNKA|nr:hypothetical protein SKAU_G00251750 [Synaphobranchus kaupii]
MAHGVKRPERTVGLVEAAVPDCRPRNTQGAVSLPKPHPTPPSTRVRHGGPPGPGTPNSESSLCPPGRFHGPATKAREPQAKYSQLCDDASIQRVTQAIYFGRA